jgi:hypothetical protein
VNVFPVVDWIQGISIPGTRGTAPDVNSANRSLRADYYCTAGGGFNVLLLPDTEAGDFLNADWL